MGRNVADVEVLVGRAASAITQRRGNTASALADQADDHATDGLLFLGNPHETVPRALLIDKRLGAVDVLGWQVIRMLANADRTTAFPTYVQLQPLLRSGVGSQASRGTVARVMAVLRLTRWMSLCHRSRNASNGRVIGNVYALHDEPVSPTEASMLDSEYFAFVEQSCRHKNRAVRDVALLIRSELEDEGAMVPGATAEAPSPMARLNQRARRFDEMQPSSQSELRQFSSDNAQFSERTKPEINELSRSSQSELSGRQARTTPSSQSELSLKSTAYRLVPVANSALTKVRSSNHYLRTGKETPEGPRQLFWSDLLELQPGDRDALTDTMSALPVELQQAVLDETAGKVASGKSDNPRGLLYGLIKRANVGEFRVTQHAQQQAERRGERYVQDTPSTHSTKPRPVSPGPIAVRAPGEPTGEEAKGQKQQIDGQAARQELLASLGIRR